MKTLPNITTTGRLVVVALVGAAVFVACSGEDGLDGSEVIVDEREADEDECEYGGTVVTVGDDEHVICDGPPGEDGDDGDDGEDGDYDQILTETEAVEPGEQCEFGGQKIVVGTDEDGSGELSEEEIDDEYVMCNEACTGQLTLDVDYPEVPLSVYEEYEHQMPVDTDADHLQFAAYDASAVGGDLPTAQSVPPSMEITDYHPGQQQMAFRVSDAPSDGAEFVMIATDGCNTAIDVIEFEEVLEGEGRVYVANLTDGFGEFDVQEDDEGDDVATGLEAYDVSGPHSYEWGEDHGFEVVDGEDEIVDATGDLSFDSPWSVQTIVIYPDGDSVEVTTTSPDTSPLGIEFSRLQVHNKTDSDMSFDVGTISGDDTEIYDEEIEFPESSLVIDLDSDPLAYMGLDTDDDGEADVTYTGLAGWHTDGKVVDAFVVDDDGINLAVAIDYTDEQVTIDNPEEDLFTSAPDEEVPTPGELSDEINVVECETVDGITMDIELTTGWRGDFSIFLEDPQGQEHALKSRYGGFDADIIGNFNETLGANSGGSGVSVEPIDVFEGTEGNGTWTLTVEDERIGFQGHLHTWGLNLVCDDDDDDNGDDDNGDDDNGNGD